MINMEAFLDDCNIEDVLQLEQDNSEQDIQEESNIDLFDIMRESYESQIFIEQQTREIFTQLEYGIITEGIASKVASGVRSVLEKMRDFITKFIKFFNRKDKVEENSTASKEYQDLNKPEKKKKLPPDLQFRGIIIPEKAYKLMDGIKDDVSRVDQYIKDASEMIQVVQRKDKNTIDAAIKGNNELYEVDEYIKEYKNEENRFTADKVKDCDFEEYKKYISSNDKFFSQYKKAAATFVTELNKILAAEKKAENDINKIASNDNNTDPEFTKFLSIISKMYSKITSLASAMIQYASEVERVESYHKVNIRRMKKLNSQLAIADKSSQN